MVEKKLIFITSVLLFLGLIGIGTIQIFWLKSAVRSREQDFDKAVIDAMNDMSVRIEDVSLHPILSKVFPNVTNSRNFHIHSASGSGMVVHYFDSSGKGKEYLIKNDSIISYNREEMDKDEPGDIIPEYENKIKQSLPIEIDNLQELMARQMVSLQPINELLDTGRLKEIIYESLEARGIKTKVKYGITEFAPNNFVLISKNTSLSALYHSKYSINLFQRSFYAENKTLKLLFPDQKRYLYASMWPLILSSTVFFMMTVLAFVLAFQIIFRQKKLSDMKTDFINNMTHELKTPIATISIASEMLKDSTISSEHENRNKYANIIFEENKRLANHVEKVLQIARFEKGELQLSLEDRDIHSIIRTSAKRFQLILDELDGSIELNLNAENDVIKVDELHFTNVINNLIDNAIKYNDKVPLIKINTFNISLGIQIEVIDNGIGLSKDDQQKIFEKFYRVGKGNVHDVKGFGLGLSYVKTIIEAHNGKIWVESKLKEGSKFIIQLPLN